MGFTVANGAVVTSVTVRNLNGDFAYAGPFVIDTGATESTAPEDFIRADPNFGLIGMREVRLGDGSIGTKMKAYGGSWSFKAQKPDSTEEKDVFCNQNFFLGPEATVGQDQINTAGPGPSGGTGPNNGCVLVQDTYWDAEARELKPNGPPPFPGAPPSAGHFKARS